jgi:hypothetical protein
MKEAIMRNVLAALARALLLFAAFLLACGVVLFLMWWRVVTYPYRKASGNKQADWKTQLELVGALGASGAALYYSLKGRAKEAAEAPAPEKAPRVPASIRVRGETFSNPDEALVRADELEHHAEELAVELRERGKHADAEAVADRAYRDAEKLREWAHAATDVRAAA